MAGSPGQEGEALRNLIDGKQLLQEIGIDDDEIAWRKDYSGLIEEDVERLKAMESMFDEIKEDLVDEFYDNIEEYGRTLDILDKSTRTVEQLKGTQTDYLMDFGKGRFGERYFQDRARIGKIHDMLEMGPEIYLGAYNIYYQGIVEAIAEDVKESFSEVFERDEFRQRGVLGGLAGEPERVSRFEEMKTDLPEEEERPFYGPESLDLEDMEKEDVFQAAVEETTERILSFLKVTNLDQQVAMDTYIHSYSKEMEEELQRRQEVSEDIDMAIEELKSSSEEVADSSQEISSLAENLSGSIEQVSGEVSNLSATVEEIAASAEEVNDLSKDAEEMAEEGQDLAQEAIKTMSEMEDASHEVSSDVDSLQKSVEEIDEIVEVINEIADQTNLLALNASIEAARAGEAGEGFAVVADEVKSLAEESQERAGEIEKIVGEIQEDTEGTVDSLEEQNNRIEEGVEIIESAGDNLNNISDAVRDTSQGIEEVAHATDDQAASTEEAAAMIDEAANKAEQVSNRVEDIAAANEENTAKVNEIRSAMRKLVGAEEE